MAAASASAGLLAAVVVAGRGRLQRSRTLPAEPAVRSDAVAAPTPVAPAPIPSPALAVAPPPVALAPPPAAPPAPPVAPVRRPASGRSRAVIGAILLDAALLALSFAAGFALWRGQLPVAPALPGALDFTSSEHLATSVVDAGRPLPLWQWLALGLCALVVVIVVLDGARAIMRRVA